MMNRISPLLAILATIIAAIIGAVAVQNVYLKGSSPPKELEETTLSPSDPLDDLTKDGSQISIDVMYEERSLKNLRIVTSYLENTGDAPITPNEITEPLSVEGLDGWQIINVTTPKGWPVRANWTRDSENRFSVSPLLLNPGDILIATVYMTHGQDPPPDLKADQKILQWSGRIVNLKEIKQARDPVEAMLAKAGPIIVMLWVWPIFFILLTFIIYAYFTVKYFKNLGILELKYGIGVLVIALLVNICASEAGATLVFGTSPYSFEAPVLIVNLPIFAINIAMLLYLYLKNAQIERTRA